jgi:pyridoxamine 5'-phosphate oxidase
MSDRNHKELDGIRREYAFDQLDESSITADPLLLLAGWLEDARQSNTPDPTAMTLSTVDANGSPSSRIVLLKRIHQNKLIFFTSYLSKKAREINDNSRVAAHFYWPQLERQVKITGVAEILEDSGSDTYFRSRPFESKLAAWASPQSEVIPDRDHLEQEFQKYYLKFKDSGEVPRPSHWGGYAISPLRIEFWQGGRYRLHDRIEYSLKDEAWSFVRLAP